MNYLALYRQWRPKLLTEIVGQKHVTETLRNAIIAGRVSHAYLFCGPRGTGKTSTAKVLARAVNCSDLQSGEPCNLCQNCREALSGATMDIVEIDAASNRGIDEIRDLKENIKYFPSLGFKKVYIVDEVHMLTNEAFNALLKTLEEPPAHVLFILATTEPHKVPLTILSRCQRFDFRPISEKVIADRLREVAAKSGINIEDGAIKAITRASGGSLRDAFSVLDQALLLSGDQAVTDEIVHGILGTVREELLLNISGCIAEKAVPEILKLVADIISEGKELHLFAGELTEFLRGLLISKLQSHASEDGIIVAGCEAPVNISSSRLIRAIDLMVEAEQVMRRTAHPRVVLELALIRACREADPGQAELLLRIERLEQAINSLNNKPVMEAEVKYQRRAVEKMEIPAVTNVNKPPVKGNTTKDSSQPKETAKPVLKQPAVPVKDEQAPVVNNATVYDLEQIKKWWPDVLELIKKKSIAVYNYLCQVWPAEVKDHCLVLGVQEGDIFTKQIIEQDEAKEMLSQTLFSFTRQKWQIRSNYCEAPPQGWEEQGGQQLECSDAISLFQAEEVAVDNDDDV